MNLRPVSGGPIKQAAKLMEMKTTFFGRLFFRCTRNNEIFNISIYKRHHYTGNDHVSNYIGNNVNTFSEVCACYQPAVGKAACNPVVLGRFKMAKKTEIWLVCNGIIFCIRRVYGMAMIHRRKSLR